MYILRALAIWLVIIFAESVNGTLRVLFLEPRIGELRAKQVGFFIALVLIYTITYLFIGWIRAKNTAALFVVGFVWAILTFVFEIGIGLAQGFSRERILADYNMAQGGLMPFGLLLMMLAPFITSRLKKK